MKDGALVRMEVLAGSLIRLNRYRPFSSQQIHISSRIYWTTDEWSERYSWYDETIRTRIDRLLSLGTGTGCMGFWAHRRINEMACYLLPEAMFGFYKANISYITEHATDPDLPAIVTPREAPRHFIDLDRYGNIRSTACRIEERMLLPNTRKTR